MNTPAHLIFGAAAFGQPDRPRVTAAALAGSLVPDLSLYFMVAWARWGQGADTREIFGRLYFSDGWMAVFAVDNSIPLWSLLLIVALWLRRPVLTAFFAAGLLHLGFDFVLHGQDARPQFWPFTGWKFDSPLSYWDRTRYAGLIGPAELATSALLAGWMLWAYRGLGMRLLVVGLLVAEIVSAGGWHFWM
ncbi:cobalamin biosynthesis protein CobQ [Limimaricola sp.]|uniref:cobalamin biosynthesis protein CobQ n=1 Tax=Limimaricola sp. TaxID=2211665 RepID=UPI004059C0F5